MEGLLKYLKAYVFSHIALNQIFELHHFIKGMMEEGYTDAAMYERLSNDELGILIQAMLWSDQIKPEYHEALGASYGSFFLDRAFSVNFDAHIRGRNVFPHWVDFKKAIKGELTNG
jgi:hypothetical protein